MYMYIIIYIHVHVHCGSSLLAFDVSEVERNHRGGPGGHNNYHF